MPNRAFTIHLDPPRRFTAREKKVRAIYHYLKMTGLSQEQFCRAIGITPGPLNRFLNGRTDLYLRTWELMESCISRAGIDWREF